MSALPSEFLVYFSEAQVKKMPRSIQQRNGTRHAEVRQRLDDGTYWIVAGPIEILRDGTAVMTVKRSWRDNGMSNVTR